VQIPEIHDVQITISARSVKISATCSHPSAITSCGFEIQGTEGERYPFRTQCDETGIFSFKADGLIPDSDYRIRAFIENGYQIRYSDWTSCHTKPIPSFIIRSEAGVFSATLYAQVSCEEGQKGFLFGESESMLKPYPLSDGVCQVSGLEPAHSYRFAAYVEMDGLEEKSEIQTFTTKDCFSDVTALIDEDRSVQLSAQILFADEAVPETSGFYLGTDQQSMNALSIRQEGSKWNAEAHNLSACQEYWYCAYVTLGGKEYRSPMKQFETGVAPFEDPVFWEYLLGNFDTDRNRQLSRGEMGGITFLPLFNLGIRSLSGIENFRNLREIQMEEDKLTHLDFSSIADIKIDGLVLWTPNLEQFNLPAMHSPESKHGGHIEFHSHALKGHWEFPDYAAGQVIIEAPLHSINLDRIKNKESEMSLTLSETEIEELDLSNLSVKLTYIVLSGNEKLKTVWLPYGSGNSISIQKDAHTQIKYK